MMPFIHEAVVRELSTLKHTIPHLEVSYQYPSTWESFPKISYYIESNVPNAAADDGIYTYEVHVRLDIWAKTLGRLLEVSEKVDLVMRNKLYMHQLWYSELKEPDRLLYRAQFKYVITI